MATRALMAQAAKYNIKSENGFTLPEKLRASYKQKLTFHKVFSGFMRGEHDPATGFCAVTSYYIYEQTGGDAVWDFMQTPVHWWLRHKQTGETFDVTYTQFDKPFPYEMGIPDVRINNDDYHMRKMLQFESHILARCAGLE